MRRWIVLRGCGLQLIAARERDRIEGSLGVLPFKLFLLQSR
jgi:hypothetical protein